MINKYTISDIQNTIDKLQIFLSDNDKKDIHNISSISNSRQTSIISLKTQDHTPNPYYNNNNTNINNSEYQQQYQNLQSQNLQDIDNLFQMCRKGEQEQDNMVNKQILYKNINMKDFNML